MIPSIVDYAYFTDWRKYPNTLFMVEKNGNNELLERIDERFNFHEH